MHDFDFSAFDSQDLISTDVPMPSSPPAWFGVYEDDGLDGGGGDGGGSLWGDDALLPTMVGSSPLREVEGGGGLGKRWLFGENSPTMSRTGKGLLEGE